MTAAGAQSTKKAGCRGGASLAPFTFASARGRSRLHRLVQEESFERVDLRTMLDTMGYFVFDIEAADAKILYWDMT